MKAQVLHPNARRRALGALALVAALLFSSAAWPARAASAGAGAEERARAASDEGALAEVRLHVHRVRVDASAGALELRSILHLEPCEATCHVLLPGGERRALEPAESARPLELSLRVDPAELGAGRVAGEGAWLTGRARWYPHGAETHVRGRLELDVPAGWKVAAAGRRDLVEERGGRRLEVFETVRPLGRLAFAAAPFRAHERELGGTRLGVLALPTTSPERGGALLGVLALAHESAREAFGTPPYASLLVVETPFPPGGAPLSAGAPLSLLFARSEVMASPALLQAIARRPLSARFGGVLEARDAGTRAAFAGLAEYFATHVVLPRLEARGQLDPREARRGWAAWLSAAHASELVVAAEPELAAARAALLFHGLARRYGERTLFAALGSLLPKRGVAALDAAGLVGPLYAAPAAPEVRAEGARLIAQLVEPELELGALVIEGVETRVGPSGGRVRVRVRYDIEGLSVPARVLGEQGESRRLLARVREGEGLGVTRVDFAPRVVEADPELDLPRRLAPERTPPLLRVPGAGYDLVVVAEGRLARQATRFGALLGEPRREEAVAPEELARARRALVIGEPSPRLAAALAPAGPRPPGLTERLAEGGARAERLRGGGDLVVVSARDARRLAAVFEALEALPAARSWMIVERPQEEARVPFGAARDGLWATPDPVPRARIAPPAEDAERAGEEAMKP